MAHEAGHFIGRVFVKGKLIGGYPHLPELNSLMHDGASYKVSFMEVIRTFNNSF